MKRPLLLRVVLVPVTAALLLGGSFTPAQAADGNNGGLPDLLGRLMPWWFGPEDGPRPEETLQAPFMAPEEESATPEGGVIYRSSDGNEYRRVQTETGYTYDVPVYVPPQDPENAADLSQAHRQPAQIGDWLIRATSEIFTMNSENYRDHLLHLSTGMSQGGIVDFNNFMRASGVLEQLEQEGMELRGYVEQPPLLLNEGALNGRYRWLFEMPVTLTLLERGTRSYKGLERTPDMTRYYVVQTQIGRVEDNATQDDIEIETWTVRVVDPPPASAAP